MQEKEKSFMGIGWAFPPGMEPDGKLAMAEYEKDIHQSIKIILGTAYGERVMRPDFGAGLKELVFEPVNTTTMALVKHQVESALVKWEHRIDLERVTVTTDSQERNTLLIEISYRVRVTNALYNMVYPFYLLEGQET